MEKVRRQHYVPRMYLKRFGYGNIGDECIPVSSNKAIIFRIKDKTAPLISKDLPENGVINLSLNSVIAYNCMQLAMGQKFLFGTSNTIKYMKKMWEARSAGRNKRK